MSAKLKLGHYRYASFLRRVASDRSGMAATEFALLLPIMVVLFFGILELSEGMTANRRVAVAVNTAADLAAQSLQLSPTEVDGLMESVIPILEPATTSAVDINLVSIILDADGDPIIHWSLHWNNDVQPTAPYVVGEEYTKLTSDFRNSPNGLARLQNRSMIIVEMTYPYAPQFAKYFVSDPIPFSRDAKRAPRRVTRVQLCDDSGNNCTT